MIRKGFGTCCSTLPCLHLSSVFDLNRVSAGCKFELRNDRIEDFVSILFPARVASEDADQEEEGDEEAQEPGLEEFDTAEPRMYLARLTLQDEVAAKKRAKKQIP